MSSDSINAPAGTYVPLPEGMNVCPVEGWDFSSSETRTRHIETRVFQGDVEHIKLREMEK